MAGMILRLLLALPLFPIAMPAFAASVLMISVDGMRPDYVTAAAEHGISAPNLRRLMQEGAYADGVRGVWPTITYPSHTTLVTGVDPAKHGIYSNALFDPMRTLGGAWYWYADAIRVPTLWDAARAAHLSTASIGWPVTVGAPVDYLIPEYWRGPSPSAGGSASDRELMAALSRPDGMLDEMQRRLGPYMMGNETTTAGDRIKTRYAIDILKRRHPALMTLHLSSLDEAEHEHAPFSPEANHALEAIDGMVGELWSAARKVDPNATLVVVSDHGFMAITHLVNLTVPFLQAGLIQQSHEASPEDREITGWRAQLWLGGGMAAVILHDPSDEKTRGQVADLLHRLAIDPANGIDSVLGHDQIAQRGAFPDADFLVVMKPGYYTGDRDAGPLVMPIPTPHGGHGFSPEFPEMRASFFAAGPGIAHRDLGVIDMRQVAPTVAALLGARMPSAAQPPLSLGKTP